MGGFATQDGFEILDRVRLKVGVAMVDGEPLSIPAGSTGTVIEVSLDDTLEVEFDHMRRPVAISADRLARITRGA